MHPKPPTSDPPSSESPPCDCGKHALVSFNSVSLCVDCYYKFEVARTLGLRSAVMAMNNAAAQLDHITGLKNFTPKMQVPDIPEGPIILNNIKVSNSVVGSINTGTVQTIDVSITYLSEGGNEEVSRALKALTEAVINSSELSRTDRQDLLDQIAYLSEQAAGAAKDRKPGMIKAALSTIRQAAETLSTIVVAWNGAESILYKHFWPS